MARQRAQIEDEPALIRDWCAGVLPERAVAERHKLSLGALQRWAKAQGLTRDVTAAVQRRARQQIANDLANESRSAANESKSRNESIALTRLEIADAAGDAVAEVIRRHRGQIKDGWDQISVYREAVELRLKQLAEQDRKALEEVGGDVAMAALAPGLQSTGKLISELLSMRERLISLERQALNIDDLPPVPPEGGISAQLRELMQRTGSVTELMAIRVTQA